MFLLGCSDAYRADENFEVISANVTGYKEKGYKYRYTVRNTCKDAQGNFYIDLYFYSDTLYAAGDILVLTKK